MYLQAIKLVNPTESETISQGCYSYHRDNLKPNRTMSHRKLA